MGQVFPCSSQKLRLGVKREQARDENTPLLFVGEHGLRDGKLVGSVGSHHVLSHPGHHVWVLLGCTGPINHLALSVNINTSPNVQIPYSKYTIVGDVLEESCAGFGQKSFSSV